MSGLKSPFRRVVRANGPIAWPSGERVRWGALFFVAPKRIIASNWGPNYAPRRGVGDRQLRHAKILNAEASSGRDYGGASPKLLGSNAGNGAWPLGYFSLRQKGALPKFNFCCSALALPKWLGVLPRSTCSAFNSDLVLPQAATVLAITFSYIFGNRKKE